MNKIKNFISYIIIILLVIALSVITTLWIVERGKTNTSTDNTTTTSTTQSTKETTQIQDEVKLLDTLKNGDAIIQQYQITLNGISSKFNVTYKKGKDDAMDYVTEIEGSLNNNDVFYIRYSDGDFFNIESINKLFNVNNFTFIKGTDNKNYLGIVSSTESLHPNYFLLVLNNKYQKISSLDITRGANMVTKIEDSKLSKGYGNVFNIKDEEIDDETFFHLKIDNDKIYYLYTKFNEDDEISEDNLGIVEERVYTISNDKVSYSTINTYKILQCAEMD